MVGCISYLGQIILVELIGFIIIVFHLIMCIGITFWILLDSIHVPNEVHGNLSLIIFSNHLLLFDVTIPFLQLMIVIINLLLINYIL